MKLTPTPQPEYLESASYQKSMKPLSRMRYIDEYFQQQLSPPLHLSTRSIQLNLTAALKLYSKLRRSADKGRAISPDLLLRQNLLKVLPRGEHRSNR